MPKNPPKTVRKKASSKPREAPNSIDESAQVKADINRFLAFKHSDPHQVLGLHRNGESTDHSRVQTRRQSGRVRFGTSSSRPMVRTNESGMFELSMETAAKSSSYRLKVYRFDGEVTTIRDPYSFAPTIGELDLAPLRRR